jgi:hypothetical protein
MFVLIAASVLTGAQTNLPPAVPAFPHGKEASWMALIPPITFTITWLFGKIPALPKVILPWITPLVGLGIGTALEWSSGQNWPWWSSAGAGTIAVAMYEAAKGVAGAGPASALTPTPEPQKLD